MKDRAIRIARAAEALDKKLKERDEKGGLVAGPCNEFLRSFDPSSLDEREADVFAEFLGRSVAKAFKEQFFEEDQEWRLRPSGQKCTREEALKKLGLDTPHPPELRGTFFRGYMLEAWGKTVAEMAGLDLRSPNMKVTLPLPGGEGEGEIDNLLEKNGKLYVVDWKSTAGIQYVKLPYEDKWGYVPQQKVYMMSKELFGQVEGALLVFIDAGSLAEFREVPVPPPTEEDYKRWMTHCQAIMDSTEESLPARPEWATLRTVKARKPTPHVLTALEDVRCKLCSNKDVCWDTKWKERNREWVR